MTGFMEDEVTILFGGKGDDVIRGGFGGDLFVFSEGNDLIEDFRFSENDRIQIEADVFYQIHQRAMNYI